MTIETTFNISDALAEMGTPLTTTFWTNGEVPDKIGYIVANSTAHMRLRLMYPHLGDAFPRDELLAMLCYYQLKKLKFNARVAAVKFKILKAASDKSVEWSEELDHDAEAAAWRVVRAAKRNKPGR